ncbi:MAG: hypothetical protein MUF10_16425 [Thermoanaerobaculaceae bacterium]|nr:hypothetical protein [Thermoanaerobaculaceae bacterium]
MSMLRHHAREGLRRPDANPARARRLLVLAAGRLLLVGSLLPSTALGFSAPPCQSLTGPPTMAAAGWARPLAAEAQDSVSGRTAPPNLQTVLRHRHAPLLGITCPPPRLASTSVSPSHVPTVERGAPDPPHLPPAPWRAPPAA